MEGKNPLVIQFNIGTTKKSIWKCISEYAVVLSCRPEVFLLGSSSG